VIPMSSQILSAGMLHNVVWYIDTKVSDKSADSIFRVENFTDMKTRNLISDGYKADILPFTANSFTQI
jgi:hypothetical protein